MFVFNRCIFLLLILGFALTGFFTMGIAPLLSIYIIILGFITVLILIPFPRSWVKLNKKYAPFLHSWKGRGFYLMLYVYVVLN